MIKIDKLEVKVNLDRVALDRVLDSREVKSVVTQSANVILKYQKIVCPVDSGNMLAHLQKVKNPTGRGYLIGVFPKVGLPDVDYVLFVINGHRSRDGSWVHPQPFIQSSADALPNRIEG